MEYFHCSLFANCIRYYSFISIIPCSFTIIYGCQMLFCDAFFEPLSFFFELLFQKSLISKNFLRKYLCTSQLYWIILLFYNVIILMCIFFHLSVVYFFPFLCLCILYGSDIVFALLSIVVFEWMYGFFLHGFSPRFV